LVSEVEALGSIVTKHVVYTAMQGVVTFIFLLYMLWSPIKVQGNPLAQEVVKTTERYLKVKCLLSAFAGLCITIVLAAVGLELPAAFGLLAFLTNFLPGVGSLISSVLPCMLAVIDARKTPTQVFLALFGQIVVHFCIDFLIEPVFFGISVEIHSVVVILNIYFFYQVWGVPGMLLSVPLLAVLRIIMRSFKEASPTMAVSRKDVETIVFFDSILEGRWMSSVTEDEGGEDLSDLELDLPNERHLSSLSMDDSGVPTSPGGDPNEAPHVGLLERHKELWNRICDSPVGRQVRNFQQTYELEIQTVCLSCAILFVICL